MNLYTPKQLADSMRVVRKNTIVIAEDSPKRNTIIARRRIAVPCAKPFFTWLR